MHAEKADILAQRPPQSGPPRRLAFAAALVFLPALVALPISVRTQGVVGVLWTYPAMVMFHFVLERRQANLLNVSLVGLVTATAAMTLPPALTLRSGVTLLLTILLHAAVNNTKDIVPSVSTRATGVWTLSTSPSAWITVAVLWLCAMAFLIDTRRQQSALHEGRFAYAGSRYGRGRPLRA